MTTKNTAAILALVAQLTTLLAEDQAKSEDVSSIEPKTAPTRSNRVLLTAEEAAERLGVGRTTMYRLIGSGEVESVQIGRLRRIPATAVDAYARKLLQDSDAA